MSVTETHQKMLQLESGTFRDIFSAQEGVVKMFFAGVRSS